jgi:hypothetical protein
MGQANKESTGPVLVRYEPSRFYFGATRTCAVHSATLPSGTKGARLTNSLGRAQEGRHFSYLFTQSGGDASKINTTCVLIY